MRPTRAGSLVLVSILAIAACKPGTSGDPAPVAPATATPRVAAPAAGNRAAEPAPVRARSARDEVMAAMDKFRRARAYHARMTMEGARGTLVNAFEFVAPDRFRMQLQDVGTQTVIGDRMWMTMRGRTVQVPAPPGTSQKWRDPANFEAAKADLAVEPLGREDLDGQPTRKFLTRHTRPKPGEVTLWIDGDDLPVQMRVRSEDDSGAPTTVTVRYSRFDDPGIRIDPP